MAVSLKKEITVNKAGIEDLFQQIIVPGGELSTKVTETIKEKKDVIKEKIYKKPRDAKDNNVKDERRVSVSINDD